MNTKELRDAIAAHFKVKPEAVDPAFYTRGQTVRGYVTTANGRQRFELSLDELKPKPAAKPEAKPKGEGRPSD